MVSLSTVIRSMEENDHVGFMLSCYDAELSYDRHMDTFQARYRPHGRRPIAIENGITWERLRAPPTDTPCHDLHISDCLNDLRPGDHIEIQWRRNKEFPYGLDFNQAGFSSRQGSKLRLSGILENIPELTFFHVNSNNFSGQILTKIIKHVDRSYVLGKPVFWVSALRDWVPEKGHSLRCEQQPVIPSTLLLVDLFTIALFPRSDHTLHCPGYCYFRKYLNPRCNCKGVDFSAPGGESFWVLGRTSSSFLSWSIAFQILYCILKCQML
ncbi:hypothetical protein K1719_005644 [Acacia pycnantha]|nr:hypothetical protein K1719_005644 [Acacia pycnantha]